MYTRCLFCTADLGRNEALEAFPVGRRLAFDAAKGRLWVVCPGCARWNLTPLEERWEAVEQAGRAFSGARVIAASDHIGLARVADRTELVRVGRPRRPEFAAWRYGSHLMQRRQAYLGRRAVGWLIQGGLSTVQFMFGGPLGIIFLLRDAYNATRPDDAERSVGAQVPVRISGRLLPLTFAAADVDLVGRAGTSVDVEVPFGRTRRVLDPADGRRVLDAMLLRMNGAGATGGEVQSAVERLARAGSVDAYLQLSADRTARARAAPRKRAHASSPRTGLHAIAPLDRLALEMALHEQREWAAMEGEVAALEQAWRDADEIAAIADGLVLPRGVQNGFVRLRRGAGLTRPG